ncbi:hypothetical protein ACP6PL_08195, partial [Dapis sp. BLCC M126]|uniref:hypothetical protein n=1 Tax=Dapis sp. BLCC M126 TaxID=3400189 RepID=UPI003CF994F7
FTIHLFCQGASEKVLTLAPEVIVRKFHDSSLLAGCLRKSINSGSRNNSQKISRFICSARVLEKKY